MGATTNDKSQLLYLNKGKFNFKVGENEWSFHEAWEGYISAITWKFIEGKDGKAGYEAINLHLDDGTEKAIVTCKFDSGYGRGMAQTLFGVDFNFPVKVSASYTEEDGKKRGSFFMSQNGQSIKWKFTRDNPGGMPEAKELTWQGQKLFDRTEQMAWLKEKIQQEVIPKIPNALFRGAAVPDLPGSAALADVQRAREEKRDIRRSIDPTIPDEDDDLPF